MLATKDEISEAEEEGIKIINSYRPKEIHVDELGQVSKVTFKKCTRTIDPKTLKFSPEYNETDTQELKVGTLIYSIGQEINWSDLLKDTNVQFWRGNYPVSDKFTYQTGDDDIFVGGDVNTGPRFIIDAIAQGHEASESLARHVRYNVPLTTGRDRRYFLLLNKDNIKVEGYDTCGRQVEGMNENIDYKNSFADAHNTFTEE